MFRLSLISSAGALALRTDNGKWWPKFRPSKPYYKNNVAEDQVEATEPYHTMVGHDNDPEKAKRNIGLRCCSANDTMCTSWSDESRYLTSATGCSYNGGAIHGKPMTYSDAEAFCKDKGQALCPKEMLQSYSRGSCEWSEHMGHSVKSCAGGCRGSAVLEGLNPCWHNSRNMYAKDEE